MYDHNGFQEFPAYFAEDMLGRTTELCMHYLHGKDNTWSTVSAKAMSGGNEESVAERLCRLHVQPLLPTL